MTDIYMSRKWRLTLNMSYRQSLVVEWMRYGLFIGLLPVLILTAFIFGLVLTGMDYFEGAHEEMHA